MLIEIKQLILPILLIINNFSKYNNNNNKNIIKRRKKYLWLSKIVAPKLYIKQTKILMTKEDIFRVLEINKEQKQQILIQ